MVNFSFNGIIQAVTIGWTLKNNPRLHEQGDGSCDVQPTELISKRLMQIYSYNSVDTYNKETSAGFCIASNSPLHSG